VFNSRVQVKNILGSRLWRNGQRIPTSSVPSCNLHSGETLLPEAPYVHYRAKAAEYNALAKIAHDPAENLEFQTLEQSFTVLADMR